MTDTQLLLALVCIQAARLAWRVFMDVRDAWYLVRLQITTKDRR